MRKKHNKYDDEFMRNAVTFLITSGKTIQEVASDLGISKSALGNWKIKYEATAKESDISKGRR